MTEDSQVPVLYMAALQVTDLKAIYGGRVYWLVSQTRWRDGCSSYPGAALSY